MLWMGTWVHPYTVPPVQVRMYFGEIKGMAKPMWCCKVMVKAPMPCKLHPTSISYIQSVLAPWYAVDGHMCAPLHCSTCAGGGWFWKIGGVGKSKWCCKVMFEAQSLVNSIPHSCHIYTKCFSTLICCGWAHGCTLTLFHMCWWGWIWGKLSAC